MKKVFDANPLFRPSEQVTARRRLADQLELALIFCIFKGHLQNPVDIFNIFIDVNIN